MNRRTFLAAAAAGVGASLAFGATAAETKIASRQQQRLKLGIASYSY